MVLCRKALIIIDKSNLTRPQVEKQYI